MNPLQASGVRVSIPSDNKFDEDTQQKIKQGLDAGYSEQQVMQKAQEYQAQKGAQISKKQTDPVIDWLPAIGGIAGSLLGAPLGLPGVIAGGAIGSGLGTAGKQKLKGEDFNLQEIGVETALGAAGGVAGKAVGVGAKLLGKTATTSIPERLMSGVFKEPIKATKSAIKNSGETLGQAVLKKGGVDTTEGFYQKAIERIASSEDELQGILINTTKTVPISDIRKTVNPLIKEYKQAGNLAAANSLENRVIAIEMANGSNMPASAANEIKRSLYSEAQRAYGTEASAQMEGIKTIARGIKESLDDVPGVNQINKDLSHFGSRRDSMLNKMTRDQRNNVLGLTDAVLGGGGIAAGQPLALGGILAKNALGSTLGKTAIAQGLYKTGQLAGNLPPIVGKVAGAGVTASAQGAMRLPQAFVDNNGSESITEEIPSAQPKFGMGGNLPQTGTNTNTTSSSTLTGHTPEQLYRAMSRAQGAGDKASAAALRTMFTDETAYQKTNGVKPPRPLSAVQQQSANKATAALKALNRIQTDISKDSSVLMKRYNPFNQSGRAIDADVRSIIDVIGSARTGATLTDEQAKTYRSMFPSALDSASTIERKMNAVREELSGMLNQAPEVTTPEYTGGALPVIQ